MPFALILIGAIIAVAGIRDTYGITQPDGSPGLWGLIRGDFTTHGGFLVWVAAIVAIGALGYVPRLKPLSVALMTLVLLVLVISNKGVFAQLQSFVQGGADASPNNTVTGVPIIGGNSSIPNTVQQGATLLNSDAASLISSNIAAALGG